MFYGIISVMAKPFEQSKKDITLCLKHSKLSALVPLVEQLSISEEYSPNVWPNDDKQLFIHHPNATDNEWLIRLMTHYSCGCLDFWPHYKLVPANDSCNIMVLEESTLPEPVCVHRRIAYDSDIILSVISSIVR